MHTEHGKIEGDLEVSDTFTLHGMVTGNISVLQNGNLHIHGMCIQNLAIQPGGSAYIHGIVNGDVINNEGFLEVHGIVNGSVHTINGRTVISPKARINNNKVG